MKDEVGLSCLLYMSLYGHRLDSRKRHSGRSRFSQRAKVPGAIGPGSRPTRLTRTPLHLALEPTPKSRHSSVTPALGRASPRVFGSSYVAGKLPLRTELRILAG